MLNTLNWTPAIGDPTFMGWFTVFLYFLTSGFAFVIACKYRHLKTDFRFWGCLSIFLLVLGINKQLDIQSLFTEIGRGVARNQGWYEVRRSIQSVFVFSLFCLTLFFIFIIWLKLRGQWKKYLFPFTGVLLLVSFVVIRAASFHHVDKLLKYSPAGIRMNWILELGGIGWLLISATYRLKQASIVPNK